MSSVEISRATSFDEFEEGLTRGAERNVSNSWAAELPLRSIGATKSRGRPCRRSRPSRSAHHVRRHGNRHDYNHRGNWTPSLSREVFDGLPILADALEDAGCDDSDILSHCRSGPVHVRGCWVVDLLLGKS